MLAWILLTAICLLLYLQSTQYGIITGSAQVIHHDAAPLQSARVKEIFVQIGAQVTNGQPIAQMDTTLVDIQIAEAEAMLASAQGNMASYQGQMLNLAKDVDDEILRSQRAIALLKNQFESDSAKLSELKTIQSEREKLFKSNLIAEELADALRPEIAALEKQVAAYPDDIAMEQRLLDDQQKHRSDVQSTLHLKPQDDIMKAVVEKAEAQAKILRSVVEMRKQEKETYTLRAPADGVVSDILVFPGTVDPAGQSVVSIVSQSDLIIGYLPEFRLGKLKKGDRGFAFRFGKSAESVTVVDIIPEVTPIPAQLSPISAPLGAVMRSQKIVFHPDKPMGITAGEKVEIRLGSEFWVKAERWLLNLKS